jgi:integrase
MKGSVVKRCACPTPSGSGRRKACSKGHGTWGYIVDIGPNPKTGKRRQQKRFGFPTKHDAETALAEAVTEANQGRYRDDGRRTVENYLQEWIDTKVANGLRLTTARTYRQHIDAYLVPYIGHVRMRDLRPSHVTRMLVQLSERAGGRNRRSAQTVQRVRATLRSALADALRDGLVKHNAARDAQGPRGTRPKVRPWEPAQLGEFLDYVAGNRLGALYQLLALTGLRRGEACGLRWADVDLTSSRLVVCQQVVQLDGQTFRCRSCGGAHRGVDMGPPKTGSGDTRRVDLGDQVVGILMDQRLRQDTERAAWGDAYVDHDLVFAREDGNPLSPEHVTKRFRRLVAQTGLPPQRLHDLRHGRASLLLASGADLAVVSKMLGHSSYAITADTYAHLLDGMGRQAANAADALVLRKPRDQPVTSAAPTDSAGDHEGSETAGQVGGPPGTRTLNPRIKSPLLCQLS